MSRLVLDHDPLSGVTTYFDFGHDEKVRLSYEQNADPHLDFSKARANDDDYTAKGIKNDAWHYAHVPVIVQYRMLYEDGVDFWNRAHRRKVFELLNTKYKHCKTTSKTHNVREE